MTAINKLRSFKHRASWRIFLLIRGTYEQMFATQLRRSKDQSTYTLNDIRLSDQAFAFLDDNHTYYILDASFGDKWCILSFLPQHIHTYPTSKIIACWEDKDLIKLFLGEDLLAARCIFIDHSSLNHLSSLFRPVHMLCMPLADTWFVDGCMHTITPYFIKNGLPIGAIRHLHLVYYPYFNELMNVHGISYGTLLKTLLYLPASSTPACPAYYKDYEIDEAYQISQSVNHKSSAALPAVLLNIANFSHASFSHNQISLIIAALEANGFRVLINATQYPDKVTFKQLLADRKHSIMITIPPRLLALVCDNVQVVIGVLGGAMNVAVQFSKSNVLSLQTISIGTGCIDDELYAEWGKDKIWQWINKDWRCLTPDRIVENAFLGDPASLRDESLISTVETFLSKLSSSSASTAVGTSK